MGGVGREGSHLGSQKPLALCQGHQGASKACRKGKSMIGQLALGVEKLQTQGFHKEVAADIQARDGGQAAWVIEQMDPGDS